MLQSHSPNTDHAGPSALSCKCHFNNSNFPMKKLFPYKFQPVILVQDILIFMDYPEASDSYTANLSTLFLPLLYIYI